MRKAGWIGLLMAWVVGGGATVGAAPMDGGVKAAPPAGAPAVGAGKTGSSGTGSGTGSSHSGAKYSRQVKFPDNYRHWTHVSTSIIQNGHPLFEAFGGIHHIYANDKALKAWQDNKALPVGSVLVFDLLETK